MDVRKTLRRSDTLVGLTRDFRKLSTRLRGADHESEEVLFERYLASHDVRKLQIGAGSNALPGWLNTDAIPRCEGGVRLDVRNAFPFAAGTFDYVFSEHMFYQFPWREGASILRECRRILKPNGTLRIAVVDLEVLIGLYVNPDDPRSRRFVEWAADRFPAGVLRPMPAFVLNNHFRAWSAQFLYDGELMELAMREAGFTHVVRCAVGESDDENLRGVESHGRAMQAQEMVAFETMVFEGRCPS